MAAFPNKNKVLASLSVSTAILLVISTIAVCSLCGCAHAKECEFSNPSVLQLPSQQFTHTFKVDDIEDKDRMHTLDIVLYDEKGQVEKVYTPFINNIGTTCSDE